MADVKSDSKLTSFAARIRSGEVVAFPTETVYGLGTDAWNADAVAQLNVIMPAPMV